MQSQLYQCRLPSKEFYVIDDRRTDPDRDRYVFTDIASEFLRIVAPCVNPWRYGLEWVVVPQWGTNRNTKTRYRASLTLTLKKSKDDTEPRAIIERTVSMGMVCDLPPSQSQLFIALIQGIPGDRPPGFVIYRLRPGATKQATKPTEDDDKATTRPAYITDAAIAEERKARRHSPLARRVEEGGYVYWSEE